jgi:hypothetical protein
MDTGERVLKGLKDLGKPSHAKPETSEGKKGEGQEEAERVESTKSRSSEDQSGSPDGAVENGHESESSGVLVGQDECATPPKGTATPTDGEP